jgi:TRAP-type mannitol/chloroaromatic compound transport system permease large subunit
MRTRAPPGITMRDIYLSIYPFVILMAIALALVMIFPQIALWLPDVYKGR